MIQKIDEANLIVIHPEHGYRNGVDRLIEIEDYR
jgi:hypothetical protein